MITLTKDEIISSSKASKNFGQILDQLKSGKIDKFIVSKNNQLEAVIITFEEYEQIKEVFDLIEHLEISGIIKKRKDKKAGTTLDELILENNLNREDLKKVKDL